MIIEDQREVIGWLEQPSTHGGVPVERIDTHASVVFLVGDRALKLKRAVRYDFLDFSTAEGDARPTALIGPRLCLGVKTGDGRGQRPHPVEFQPGR
jgi:NADPH-dependent 2,4-dienoyl-CoA reductase/sulfur reductase-like enzyme